MADRSQLPVLYVGAGTCGLAAGAEAVISALRASLLEAGLGEATIKRVGCAGLCEREVMVDVQRPGSPRLSFGPVTPDTAPRLVQSYVVGGVVPAEMLIGVALGEPKLEEPFRAPVDRSRLKSDRQAVRVGSGSQTDGAQAHATDMGSAEMGPAEVEGSPSPPAFPAEPIPRVDELPMMKRQLRLVLANCGRIDPESLEEYKAAGGYRALERALAELSPEQVVDAICRSGLRGRGGGGFPTGRKWAMARQQADPVRYVICNADEGDPGAFMDRSVLEGDPFRVLEGLTIAGYAIGSSRGFIYVRAEYPLAIKRLEKAIQAARAGGFLGKGLLGSDFDFDIELKIGAGAFVCGEETALIASIEGERGMPRPRPPYPVVSGLWGHPTVINNVETLANVAPIIERGAEWFASIGTEKSKGTKVFALTGNVVNSGLIEVPMGTTLQQIVFECGGGIAGGRAFKAVQIGGPSGGCLPAQLLDLPIDYDSLTSAGAMMGSGGLVVMDDRSCMVEVARFFLDFTRSESCGKCTPCREGTTRLYEMVERIVSPNGYRGPHKPEETAGALQRIERLAHLVRGSSACGLGQTAPNPVLSTLRYFRHEYEAHLTEGRCPAHQCRSYLVYSIDPEVCSGCGLCQRNCPQEAIVGELRQPHRIVAERCIRCGMCAEVCRFGAVQVA